MEIDMTIRQVKTKQTTILGIMRSAPFVIGFNEGRTGQPLRYEAYDNMNQQWAYERGRQFSIIFDGPLKKGHAVNLGAAVCFAMAITSKEIF
jgi:hypothetical protein